MKVAVPTDNGNVATHFGRCQKYTIAEIKNSTIENLMTVDCPEHEPGRIPKFLKGLDVSVIITGGMGRRAIMLFDEMGIEYVVGVTGSTDEILSAFCKGTLAGGESLCNPQHRGEGSGLDCDHEH